MLTKMLARKNTQLQFARKHGWGGKRPSVGRKRKDNSEDRPEVARRH